MDAGKCTDLGDGPRIPDSGVRKPWDREMAGNGFDGLRAPDRAEGGRPADPGFGIPGPTSGAPRRLSAGSKLQAADPWPLLQELRDCGKVQRSSAFSYSSTEA